MWDPVGVPGLKPVKPVLGRSLLNSSAKAKESPGTYFCTLRFLWLTLKPPLEPLSIGGWLALHRDTTYVNNHTSQAAPCP